MVSSIISKEKGFQGSAEVFCLYGKQLPEEQQKAFQPQPKGIRKIIFATDIAETSLTIDGVRHVVDTGLTKDNIYDTQRNITTLTVPPWRIWNLSVFTGGSHYKKFSRTTQRTGRENSTRSLLSHVLTR